MSLLPQTDLEIITRRLNRPPNPVEEGCFLNLWSEHCSYRSSAKHLRTFSLDGKRVRRFPLMERLTYLGGDILMIKKNKKFDAVRMMRKIRNELSRSYGEDPSAEGRGLQEIRKRCGIQGEWESVLLMMGRIWIRASGTLPESTLVAGVRV